MTSCNTSSIATVTSPLGTTHPAHRASTGALATPAINGATGNTATQASG